MTLKNGFLILAVTLCIIGGGYTLHLRKQLNDVRSDLREEKELRQYYIHKDRYNRLELTRDSLNEVINNFTPDSILITKIKIKYDTIEKRVLDSSYYYQLQWYKSELNRQYPDK